MAESEFQKKFCQDLGQTTNQKHPHFPKSVCNSRWITSPNEHEEHPGQSLVTHSPEVIVAWALQRNAMPATIAGTHGADGRLGELRFDVPDFGSRRTLEHVTWDQFLHTIEDGDLVMIFQEHMENGKRSNFYRFNSPYREHE